MQPHDGRAVPTFIWQSLHQQPLTVTGDGSHTRSPCHVDDVVDVLVRLGRSGANGPINIGNPEEIRVLDLHDRVVSDAAVTERAWFRLFCHVVGVGILLWGLPFGVSVVDWWVWVSAGPIPVICRMSGGR